MTTNGAWSPSEHVPIFFKSNLAMGMVPVDFPAVRWVPTDIAASVVIKEAFQDNTALQYYAVSVGRAHPRESLRVAPELAVGRPDEKLMAKYVKWQIERPDTVLYDQRSIFTCLPISGE
ncbi:hypothetical protein JB92DRAFT_911082 [Gautieria morchelliformis]|nr:hypothetical protein JB92DRAFT_911082 [Gautieria morchelliformis]